MPLGIKANWTIGNRSPHQAHCKPVFEKDSCRLRVLIKIQFDERKGATWHCIVGRNFGSFVTHGTANVHAALSTMLIRVLFRRNKALHLLLPWPLRNPAFQDAVEALDPSLFQRSACIIFLEEIPPEQIADKKGLLNIISCFESDFCPYPSLSCSCSSKHEAPAEL